jgi:hypothetical protein
LEASEWCGFSPRPTSSTTSAGELQGGSCKLGLQNPAKTPAWLWSNVLL